MAEIREGDYVRTIIEGRWGGHVTGPVFEGEQHDTDLVEYVSSDDDRVYLEKIEAPVVTFKPGDVVRHKYSPDLTLALGHDGGYVYIEGVTPGLSIRSMGAHNPITSDAWEKVDLG